MSAVHTGYDVIKITSGPQSGSYEVVPHNWIFTSTEPVAGLNLVKIMQESNKPEDKLLLNQMIEMKSPPPEDWEFQFCDILFSTESLLEAVRQLKKFESTKVLHDQKKSIKRKTKASSKTDDINLAKKTALLEKSNILMNLCKQPASNELDSISTMEIVDTVDASTEKLPANIAYMHEDENKENSDNNGASGFANVSNVMSRSIPQEPDINLDVNILNPHQDLTESNHSVSKKLKDINYIPDLNLLLGEVKALTSSFESVKKEFGSLVKKVDSVENCVKGLRKNVVDIAKDIEELKTFVQDKRQLKENINIITFSKLKTMHQLILPFRKIDEFLKFDKKLANPDDNLSNDLKTHFFSTINTTIEKLDKALSPIMKNFITHEVAKSMVSVKFVPGKIIFCETTFGRILKECFVNAYANPETAGEKEFESAVSTVLNNARDWGGRKAKKKEDKDKEDKDKEDEDKEDEDKDEEEVEKSPG